MENILEVENLKKVYPKLVLDVSFSVPMGAVVGLIGENGAGKSTAIKTVLDLVKKDKGTVKFFGKELSSDKGLKNDIGVVLGTLGAFEKMSIKEIKEIHSSAYINWDNELFDDYCKQFGIPDYAEVKTLSSGSKMKLSFALAMSHHPKLLLLDEVTSGLDPVVRDDVLNIILDFAADGEHSVLISSHISSDLEKIADYIIFINNGKIVFKKSTDELLYRYGIIRCTEKDFESIDKDDIIAYREEAYQTSVLVEDREEARQKYEDAVIDNPTIDEIMLLYIKGKRLR